MIAKEDQPSQRGDPGILQFISNTDKHSESAVFLKVNEKCLFSDLGRQNETHFTNKMISEKINKIYILINNDFIKIFAVKNNVLELKFKIFTKIRCRGEI